MDDCTLNIKVEAYHDGALPETDRAAMERHLAECGQCRKSLAELVALSQLFAQTPPAGLSQIARERIYRKLDTVMDRGLFYLNWSLSGVAAAVLLVGSIWLMNLKDTTAINSPVATSAPWTDVVASNDDTRTALASATPVAQWYLADTSRTDDTP